MLLEKSHRMEEQIHPESRYTVARSGKELHRHDQSDPCLLVAFKKKPQLMGSSVSAWRYQQRHAILCSNQTWKDMDKVGRENE